MVSLRGWHIISFGAIWLTCSICTFLPITSWILGCIFLLLALGNIGVGMYKIVKFERYEEKRIDANAESTRTQVDGQPGYNPFTNENSS